MALPYQFNNTVYQAGFVGTDDGAPAATFGIDDVSASPITVNGTVTGVGSAVSITGIFPGETTAVTRTFYATQFDNSSQIEFNDGQGPTYTRANTRLVLSNTQFPTNGPRFTSDGNGTLGDYAAVCFAAGTRIRTVRGDVAVEALQVGDLVVTSAGSHRPVRWTGSRSLDPRRHPRPHEAQPVRIRAGAFGEGRPARDLVVSPGHSVAVTMLDEVLMPASALVNGATIVQEAVERVTYWHVELDSHEVLLAENMPAESYLDMGNRPFFADGGVVAIGASPDAEAVARTHADFCRPFHQAGVLVEAARVQLAARALELGWRLLPADRLGGLHLLVDGRRVEPEVHDLSAHVLLPAAARDVWLVSDPGVPSARGLGRDSRRLGVFLARLLVDNGFGDRRSIVAGDARLTIGFHGAEAEGRWTSGRAQLPVELWSGMSGEISLRIDLAGPPVPRWVKGEHTEQVCIAAA